MKRTPAELYALRKESKKRRIKQLKSPLALSCRPYWQYVSGKIKGDCHAEWDGLVLRHDDPWWQKHFPPTRPDCFCHVTAVRPEHYTGQIAPLD